jgi:iron(III) transport system substrate-binding protein
MARILVLLALVAVLALPFTLRPAGGASQQADDTVVIITPHNEAIRSEFGRAFAEWYRAKMGRTVRVDWRVIGGTGDIARFLESAYATAFEYDWTHRLHRPWTLEVQNSFQNARLSSDASTIAAQARITFLASNVSSGIDVFFGGDAYEQSKQAAAGRLVPSDITARHPDWFTEDTIPLTYGGEPFRDPESRWFGVVLSQYGIIYNRDSLRRLGISRDPTSWADLAAPRLVGEVALADPTKSGSVCEAFENMLQQHMQAQLAWRGNAGESAGSAGAEAEAIRAGWLEGLQLIQRAAANARYFTDASQKPPIDVAAGDCAAGLCIDFYGRQQQEAVRRRGGSDRIGYVSPRGGSVASADPISLLRGAPHREVANAFLEFTLSLEGQKLWAFRTGTPDGPRQFALRRMPVRRDFYRHTEWASARSDPEDNPYVAEGSFTYRPEWTGSLFREIGFVVRVMGQDPHEELVAAWRAINAAPEPARSRALTVLQDLHRIDYDHTRGEIHQRLNAKDRVEEVRLASELAEAFRVQYRKAQAVAEGRADYP